MLFIFFTERNTRFRIKQRLTQVIKAGEILQIFTPGGGGLGDYSYRDKELIETDIENELI